MKASENLAANVAACLGVFVVINRHQYGVMLTLQLQ
jgi:hypothetical protein